jgi:hypothetical protein
MAGPETHTASAHRSRYSFHVTYKPEEIPALAKEIVDGTIAEVHLSLFAYWICEKPEHYEEAKKHIRELGVDQVGSLPLLKAVVIWVLTSLNRHTR